MTAAPRMHVADLVVTALDDGDVFLPPSYYPGLRASEQRAMAGDDGTYRIPIGCFLIQGPDATTLVDAGLGRYAYDFPPEVAREHSIATPPPHIARGGRLIDELRQVGVRPDDIDALVLTHLHADHLGGATDDRGPVFPRAVIHVAAVDWGTPVHNPAPGEAEGRARLDRIDAVGGVRQMTAETTVIAPGVIARRIGGHTRGHTVVEVGEQLVLVGDAVHHPRQLTDPGVSFLLEDDPIAARVARELLFQEAAARGLAIGMAHLPGLRFQRILQTPEGRRWADAG